MKRDPDCTVCDSEGYVERDELIPNHGWFAMRYECPRCNPPEDEEGDE